MMGTRLRDLVSSHKYTYDHSQVVAGKRILGGVGADVGMKAGIAVTEVNVGIATKGVDKEDEGMWLGQVKA